ncbi:MAG: peptidoglycan DD-metalloendopeptidase family protein [Planctomycetes bacterium]|nr:peptidoglycan DD-metalloendopeptidase family protein [Planctomycetota bacterium]
MIDMNPEVPFRKSCFHESLIRLNVLDKQGFAAWVFKPGMLFKDIAVWWDDGGVRRKPHEGVDICFYRDGSGQNYRLTEKTMIPVLYDGKIVRIDDDFLGKSVYVGHGIYDDNGNRLYTVYGHTNPFRDIGEGKELREGDAFATIADVGTKKTVIPPHLHLSVAWMPVTFPSERLNWDTMSNPNIVTLCNPLGCL